MGHENCVFLLCIIRKKHYNKQRMSSSIPDVKKLYTTISSWEHTVMSMDYKSEHIKSIWKKKIKGFFFVLKEKAENFLNQLAIKSNGQFTEDILERVSTS